MNRKNLANALILSADGGSVDLYPGYADNMPAVPFFATGSKLGEVATIDNSEIVEVTAITGDTLTVTREQRDTTLQPLGDGWVLGNGIYTQDLDAIMAYVDTAVATAKQEAKEEAYPVGTLYYNADVATNPATLLGFGEWSAYAAGRVPVGKASSGTFGTAGATMGAETHTLSWNEMPVHSHRQYVVANTGPGDTRKDFVSDDNGGIYDQGVNTGDAGAGWAHNNIQPSIVVYIWRRTA
jgi:hypothetical protein